LLREIACRRGTAQDDVIRPSDGLTASRIAYDGLMYRGDAGAVGHYVAEALSLARPLLWAAHDLGRLPRAEVACHLRQALAAVDSDEGRAAVVRLLGHFSCEDDVTTVRGLVESRNDALANVAYEARCRLSDPLLIPADWGGL
jgi:hypothetical protein